MNGTDRASVAQDPIFFAVSLTLGTIGISGNALVCITIIRAKFMHNVTNLLIGHLALVDLLVCLTHIIFLEQFIPTDANGAIMCSLFHKKSVVWYFVSVSSNNILCVTFERYIAIVHSLHYPRFFTRVKTGLMIMAVWLTPALLMLGYLPSFYSLKDTTQLECFLDKSADKFSAEKIAEFATYAGYFIFSMCFQGFFYGQIVLNLRRNAALHRRDNNHAPANELMKAQRKVAKVITIVVGGFLVLWVTYLTLYTITFVHEELEQYFSWSQCFPVVNSLINPLIYSFMYKTFQRGVKEAVLPCCFKGHNRIAARNVDIIPLS